MNRIIFTTLGLAAVLWTAAPASAGSLLSGYGGPGQGNQAILGSTLLNGPRGGGGRGGGAGAGQAAQTGSSATSANGTPGAETGANAPGGATSTGSTSKTGARGKDGARRSHGAGGSASAGGAPAYPTPTNAVPASSSSNTLGLSGADLLLILLALGALALTGTFTMRLIRTAPSGRPQTRPGSPQKLKGRAPGPE